MSEEAANTDAASPGINPLLHLGDILNRIDAIMFRQVIFCGTLVDLLTVNKVDAPRTLQEWEELRKAWVSYATWQAELRATLQPQTSAAEQTDGEHKQDG